MRNEELDDDVKVNGVKRLETFGKRMYLRTHLDEDTASLASIFASPFSREYLQMLQPPSGWKNNQRIWTTEDFRERVQQQNENRLKGRSCVLNLILPSEECIGTTGFVRIENSIGYLGIILDQTRIRNGYATEALHASIEFAFQKLAVQSIRIQTDERNHRMRQWCEKVAQIPLVEILPITINQHSFVEYNYQFEYPMWINSIRPRLEEFLQNKIHLHQ